ncbi:hypothetical protein [Cetobacterium sp. SF1]|uniref:hypothetical protein n=1 Tax=unclassified Cetobacterium TaxID=2630983 RepID=UPI003CF156F1
MEIYIDNKKCQAPKNINFSGAMDIINDILKKQNKIVLNLYINGKELDENLLLRSENIKLIEVSTRSNRESIIESLGALGSHINKYFILLEELLASTSEYIDIEKINDMLILVTWTYSVLLAMKDNTAIDFSYVDFDEFLQDFKNAFEEAQKALELEDVGKLFDILDYELGELMLDIQSNLNAYYEEIVNEELRTNILN